MGASLGLALQTDGWTVLGWDPEPDALAVAEQRGALNGRLGSATEGVEEAELMVLAAPPAASEGTLRDLDTETLVTDIASVKTPIVDAAAHLRHFVGGHPMTGGASSGPALATSTLFRGAMWILTTDNALPEDIDTMSSVVRSVGANPVIMTAEDHDRIIARISHLPHVIATSLVELAAGEETAISLAGGGFRDLTRVAGSEPGWWTEVLTANSGHVVAAIDELTAHLERWKRALDDANISAISEALEAGRHARVGLGEHHVPVRVVLLDQPGEIARVGHALEASRADVRDFQLRHGEHGGGGILTISVSPEDADELAKALVKQGFRLQN
jgi:prephenate dehydrogenase